MSAVVIDPYTGEIYAEATYPSYDANDYQAVAAVDPNRFIDPVVSSVYEPGSVFKMITAIAGLETGTVTTKTKIKDVGTLKLDDGRTHVDDADRKGRGWMTFEDGDRLLAQRRRGEGRAPAGRGHPRPRPRSSTRRGRRLGFGAKTGIDLAGEVSGLVNDPTITAWQRDRPRERLVRPGRRGDPDPARDGVRGDGQRRHARPAPRRQVDRDGRAGARRPRPGHRAVALGHADRPDAPRRHRGPVRTATGP